MHFQFTELIKANSRVREFNFTKTSYASQNLFHVDVSDDRGNRILFKMQKEGEDQWKIMEQELPKWIYEVEVQLNDVLKEQLK
jgi:hypothetical protein